MISMLGSVFEKDVQANKAGTGRPRLAAFFGIYSEL
jgi:hypothetical protein